MFPSNEQVQVAAYHRWLHRGQDHGRHLDDWTAAEQDLLFALNYDVIAPAPGAGPGPDPETRSRRGLAPAPPRICRFCEGGTPEVRFDATEPPLPSPFRSVEPGTIPCDDCRAVFGSVQDPVLETFLRAIEPEACSGSHHGEPTELPLIAYQALTRIALTQLPEAELDSLPDTLEWVVNPEPECDRNAFAGGGLLVHRRARPFLEPWVAVARRRDDEMPLPYLLAFFGVGHVSLEMVVPLCVRDEDLDGDDLLLPRIACPEEAYRGWGESSKSAILVPSHRDYRPAAPLFAGSIDLGFDDHAEPIARPSRAMDLLFS